MHGSTHVFSEDDDILAHAPPSGKDPPSFLPSLIIASQEKQVRGGDTIPTYGALQRLVDSRETGWIV